MRRYQYKLNDQNTTSGVWGKLTPLKYIEVAAGDSISGSVSVHNRSAKTVDESKSRAYTDLYAFYVPYRVLWDEWPQFITGQTDSIQLPQMNNVREWNFEKTIGNNFLGLAYYAIWLRFFSNQNLFTNKSQENTKKLSVRAAEYERSPQGQNQITVYRRPTTYDLKMLDAELATNPINIVEMNATDSGGNPTTTINNLRQAMTEERFQKSREYYGGRYTDFLAASGIKANWNILDEPECIGVLNKDWQYKKVKGTGENNLAQVSGYFEGVNTLKLRKTFCPEHGLIVVLGACRADLFNTQSGNHVVVDKDERKDFWSPEYMHLGDRRVPVQTVSRSYGPVEPPVLYTPHYEEYRCGRNETTGNTDYVFSESNGAITVSTLANASPPASAFESEPVAVQINDEPDPRVVYGSNIPWFTEVRATRVSSVPPRKPAGVA